METPKSNKKCAAGLTLLGLAAYTVLVIWIYRHFFLNYLSKNDKNDALNQTELSIPEIELYEIMAKQYDVPNGTCQGVPYKKILYWNEGVTLSDFYYGVGVDKDAFKKVGCPVWQCETSLDKTNLSQYDALVFRHNTWDGSTRVQKRDGLIRVF